MWIKKERSGETVGGRNGRSGKSDWQVTAGKMRGLGMESQGRSDSQGSGLASSVTGTHWKRDQGGRSRFGHTGSEVIWPAACNQSETWERERDLSEGVRSRGIPGSDGWWHLKCGWLSLRWTGWLREEEELCWEETQYLKEKRPMKEAVKRVQDREEKGAKRLSGDQRSPEPELQEYSTRWRLENALWLWQIVGGKSQMSMSIY